MLVMEMNNLRHQVERIKGEKEQMGEELAQTQALLVMEHNQVQILQESKEREQGEWMKESLAKHSLLQEKMEEVISFYNQGLETECSGEKSESCFCRARCD